MPTSASQITPGRQTLVYFDRPQSTVVEDAWSVTRQGAEIAADLAKGLSEDTPSLADSRQSNMKLWASGAWTLRPLQEDISNIHEGVVCLPTIISVPAHMTVMTTIFATAVMATENAMRRNDDLPGFSASSNVQAQGDPFLVKRIPAGGTWNNNLLDGQPPPAIVMQDIPLDRVGYSKAVYPADQGFFLRWEVPGHGRAVYNYTWAFYFGQYGVSFKGTGVADLWEYCFYDNGGGDPFFQWRRRASWQYAHKGQLSQTNHTMAIWPHNGPNGERFIAFSNGQLEVADVVSSFARTSASQVAPGEFVYRCDSARRSPFDRDESPGHATKAAIVRFDIRRDLRLKVQISTLAWPTSGYLVDLPAGLPPNASAAQPVTPYVGYSAPAGCSLTTALLDGATGAPFVAGSSNQPQAKFTFASDGQGTPILWEYRMVRNAVTQTATPGTFTVRLNPTDKRPAGIRDIAVTGTSGDPSQDSAEITITDETASLPRLRTRGMIPATLVVDIGQTQKVVLHDGFVLRPGGVKRGHLDNHGQAYPAADWRDFTLPTTGKYYRLSKKYSTAYVRKYLHDGNAPPDSRGAVPPWKATDVVYDVLINCGYPDAELNIPDYPMRLYPGVGQKEDDFVVAPRAEWGEFLMRLCRDFLGAYLIRDVNAGALDANGIPSGQWTVLFPTPLPTGGAYTPLLNFVTRPDRAGVPSHLPGAYTAGNTPVFGKMDYTTVPPEFNHVFVGTPFTLSGTTGQCFVGSHAYNYKSYAVPGGTVTPDPNSAEYLDGSEWETMRVDPSLADGDSLQNTQAACDFVCRRMYDLSCHAQRLVHFTAPLAFITDAANGRTRPLRFQDPVSINGDATWLVKSCNPRYVKDGHQLADYELIQPVGGQYVPPGIEHLSFWRQAQGDYARRSNGVSMQSHRYSILSVPAHREAGILEMPSLLTYQKPLQDNTGTFGFMAGYDAVGSAPIP